MCVCAHARVRAFTAELGVSARENGERVAPGRWVCHREWAGGLVGGQLTWASSLSADDRICSPPFMELTTLSGDDTMRLLEQNGLAFPFSACPPPTPALGTPGRLGGPWTGWELSVAPRHARGPWLPGRAEPASRLHRGEGCADGMGCLGHPECGCRPLLSRRVSPAPPVPYPHGLQGFREFHPVSARCLCGEVTSLISLCFSLPAP